MKNLDISKKDLKVVFKRVLNKLPDFSILRKETVNSRIEMGSIIQSIIKGLTKSKRTSFFKFSKDMDKTEVVLTFLASLELSKRVKVKLQQNNFLGDILMLKI